MEPHRGTPAFQQQSQNLKWLLPELDFETALTQFSGFEVDLKNPKANQRSGIFTAGHWATF